MEIGRRGVHSCNFRTELVLFILISQLLVYLRFHDIELLLCYKCLAVAQLWIAKNGELISASFLFVLFWVALWGFGCEMHPN